MAFRFERGICLPKARFLLISCIAKSPFDSHQKAYLGYLEWRQYMHEMRDSVQSQLEIAKQKEEPCFLGE